MEVSQQDLDVTLSSAQEDQLAATDRDDVPAKSHLRLHSAPHYAKGHVELVPLGDHGGNDGVVRTFAPFETVGPVFAEEKSAASILKPTK